MLDIVQTKANFNMEWVACCGEEVISVAKSPFERGQFNIYVDFRDSLNQRMYFNPSDKTWGTKLKDRMSFKLFEGEDKIGYIVGQPKKIGFLKSYLYYEFEYKGKLYLGYEVGFGSNGLFFCIYEGEHTIAIVTKNLHVENFKDKYTAYLIDEKYASVVILFTLYYDSVAFGDKGEVAVFSIQRQGVNTIQKELIAKFDTAFIPAVLAMEEEKNKAT